MSLAWGETALTPASVCALGGSSVGAERARLPTHHRDPLNPPVADVGARVILGSDRLTCPAGYAGTSGQDPCCRLTHQNQR